MEFTYLKNQYMEHMAGNYFALETNGQNLLSAV